MQLVRYDAARAALEMAWKIDEVKKVRSQAAAVKAYAKQINDREMQSWAQEIYIRAERQMGKILIKMEKAGERVSRTKGRPKKGDRRSRLSDLGVSKKQATRTQELASIPDKEFDDYIEETKTKKKKVVTSGEARRHFARKTRKAKTRKKVKAGAKVIDGTFRVLLVDPPWLYGSSGVITETDSYGRANRHYESLTIDQLCKLSDKKGTTIADIMRDDAVLFLWVTSPLLAECWPVIEAWNFQYKSSMIWHKLAHNYGNYVSVRHELLLICTRGSCLPDRPTPMISSVQEFKRTKTHSAKPPEFRQFIERMYDGPYLELFGRKKITNWKVWGDQAGIEV